MSAAYPPPQYPPQYPPPAPMMSYPQQPMMPYYNPYNAVQQPNYYSPPQTSHLPQIDAGTQQSNAMAQQWPIDQQAQHVSTPTVADSFPNPSDDNTNSPTTHSSIEAETTSAST